VSTGQTIDANGAAFGDTCSGQPRGQGRRQMRWLQFIWREVIGVDDKGASKPVAGSITPSDLAHRRRRVDDRVPRLRQGVPHGKRP
jgi:hypothetical protein